MKPPPKRRSASKLKYAASHPAITVHFAVDVYNRLIALRKATGLSLNQLVRGALDSLEAEVTTILVRGYQRGLEVGKAGEAAARKLAYAEGWKAAAAVFRLTYPCPRGCGKRIEIRVGDPDANRAIEVLVDERWGHSECSSP
jgi:glutamine synthetase